MKYCKRFTESFAYFLAFLSLMFILYTYFTFGEPVPDEKTGEMITFMSKEGVKEYMILFFMFLFSAVACSLTDKIAFVGLIVSVVPFYYVLRLIKEKLLVYCPTVFIIMSAIFVAGEIAATLVWAAEMCRGKAAKRKNV